MYSTVKADIIKITRWLAPFIYWQWLNVKIRHLLMLRKNKKIQ